MTTLAADGTELAGPSLVNLFPAQLIGPGPTVRSGVRVVLMPDEIIVYAEADDERGRYAFTSARIPVVSVTPSGDRWKSYDLTAPKLILYIPIGALARKPAHWSPRNGEPFP